MKYFETLDDIVKWQNNLPSHLRFGTMHESEFRILYEYIRSLRPEFLYECGTCRGISALVSALALKSCEGKKVHTFDLENRPIGEKLWLNTNLENRIEFHHGRFSSKVPNIIRNRTINPIFVTIDGAHKYHNVVQDYSAIEPYLKSGDIVFFHDTILFHSHVGRFLKELEEKGYNITNHETPVGVGVLKV